MSRTGLIIFTREAGAEDGFRDYFFMVKWREARR